MSPDPDEIRERAWVEHRRPPLDDVDDPVWIAEDPVTDCAGLGYVEAEAVGNLVSVVAESDAPDGPDRPLLKVPGRVVNRPTPSADGKRSLFDRLRSLF